VTAPPPEADAAPEHVLLPPHPLRLAAFLIDLALVAAVAAAATALTWSLAEFIVVLVVVWVIYQTGMVWLTGGRTVGKSACGLSVRHIDGSAPDRTWAGFGWALGRASAGYLLADMLGLGVLVALCNPRRRCVHDYVFASQVVLAPADASEPGPGLMDRIDQLNKNIDAGLEANTKRFAPLWKLWKWLLVVASPIVGAWQVLTRIFAPVWRPIKKRLTAHAHPNAMGLRAKRRAGPHRLLITLGDFLRVAGGVPVPVGNPSARLNSGESEAPGRRGSADVTLRPRSLLCLCTLFRRVPPAAQMPGRFRAAGR